LIFEFLSSQRNAGAQPAKEKQFVTFL